MRISDWSSDVCSSDLNRLQLGSHQSGAAGLDLSPSGHRRQKLCGRSRIDRIEGERLARKPAISLAIGTMKRALILPEILDQRPRAVRVGKIEVGLHRQALALLSGFASGRSRLDRQPFMYHKRAFCATGTRARDV